MSAESKQELKQRIKRMGLVRDWHWYNPFSWFRLRYKVPHSDETQDLVPGCYIYVGMKVGRISSKASIQSLLKHEMAHPRHITIPVVKDV